MSLIQDALKRKREEESLRPPQKAPSVNEPEPFPFPAEKPERNSSQRLLIPIIAVIVLLLIIFGAIQLLHTDTQKATEVVKEKPKVVTEEPAPEPIIETKPAETPDNEWPKLKLTGFASGGGLQRVIINGKILSEGRIIKGARIVQVGRDEVIVEFEGERRILHVDDD